MRSVLIYSVIFLTIPAFGAEGELTSADLYARGLLEEKCEGADRNSADTDLRSISETYLDLRSFPVPEYRNPEIEATGCDAYSDLVNTGNRENAFHVHDSLAKRVMAITGPTPGDLGCAAAAARAFPESFGLYRTCPDEGKRSSTGTPCRTRTAVETMARALRLVSECVDLPKADLFRMAAANTGLVPGALSPRAEMAIAAVRDIRGGRQGGEAARGALVATERSMKENSVCSALTQADTNFRLRDELSICRRMGAPDGTARAGVFLPLLNQARSFLALKADLAAEIGEASAKPIRRKFGSDAELERAIREVAHFGSVIGEVKARAIFGATMRLPFKGTGEFLKLYRASVVKFVPAPDFQDLLRIESLPAKVKDATRVPGTARRAECY